MTPAKSPRGGKRHSVKCLLCGLRFMSELSDRDTAQAHWKQCPKFAARIAARIEYAQRNRMYGGNLETITASEVYQMRALYLQVREVSGHYNPGVPCDARCTGARGHNCECQCGGANHGQANAISAGMVAA